jgi:hypothetical protein
MTPQHSARSSGASDDSSGKDSGGAEPAEESRKHSGLAARLQTVTGVLQALAVCIGALTAVFVAVPPLRHAISALFQAEPGATPARQETPSAAAGQDPPRRSPSGPASAVCRSPHPVALFMPSRTGSKVSVTFQVSCTLSADRKYLLIEKVPHVGGPVPHPVYFVKATLPRLTAGQLHRASFVLKEPVHTRAQFYAISVTPGGMMALWQNQVRDHGILRLPSGWRRESSIRWHTKEWD